MANYVKQTWTDAVSALSAARMAFMEQGIFDSHFQPAARAFHNANQSVATATNVALALNSERYDTDTIHDLVTNNSRLTCKTAGKYHITGCVGFTANATGNRTLFLRVNGATTISADTRTNVGAGLNCVCTIAADYDMAVNDYVELVAFQDSGSTLNALVIANYSPEFSMFRVG